MSAGSFTIVLTSNAHTTEQQVHNIIKMCTGQQRPWEGDQFLQILCTNFNHMVYYLIKRVRRRSGQVWKRTSSHALFQGWVSVLDSIAIYFHTRRVRICQQNLSLISMQLGIRVLSNSGSDYASGY